MFEAVVVACGSVETAAKLDMEINSEVYASAVDGVLTKGSFAWRPKLCALSVNPTMYNLAKQISGGKVAPSAQGKRPSIVYDHHLSSAGQDAEVLEVDDLPELAVEDEGLRGHARGEGSPAWGASPSSRAA
ncbi:unnamed protein product [Prorocentrum cordatum]|uniref:Uncharacterized protein n=1 Tax=Prorocentrum cordatum TaxID=2364126 RepID=A0ABN9RGB0_9DINO|nr:unnamed protein product [Polarella glacialis]